MGKTLHDPADVDAGKATGLTRERCTHLARPDPNSQTDPGTTPEAPIRTVSEPGMRVLAVGDLAPVSQRIETVMPGEITCLAYAQVTPDALDKIRPDVVFSSLVAVEFDCLDLADRLSAAAFRGKYRALVKVLPDPDLVRREIADRFPALDFDVVIISEHDGPAKAGS